LRTNHGPNGDAIFPPRKLFAPSWRRTASTVSLEELAKLGAEVEAKAEVLGRLQRDCASRSAEEKREGMVSRNPAGLYAMG
jgi:hypothetical protein